MKPKGVTTQMKALDEYILMVLFVLLLKRVHFLTLFNIYLGIQFFSGEGRGGEVDAQGRIQLTVPC